MTADLNALMGEIGALDDEIEAVTQSEDGRWTVHFPTLDVEVERDAEGARLVLSTVLPPPPADRERDVFEALLLYTSAWRDTGGVRMALAARGGPVLQIADIVISDVTPKTVVTVARNLAARSLIWAKFLLGRSSDANEAPPPSSSDFDMSHMIRI